MVYFAIWFGWAVLSSAVIVGATYWIEETWKPNAHGMFDVVQWVFAACAMTIALGSLLALAIIATVSASKDAVLEAIR